MTEEQIKNYSVWEGKHRFWLQGTLITGAKPVGLGITFALIQITNLLCLSFSWTVSFSF